MMYVMPKRSRTKKSEPDFRQLARKVVDHATGAQPKKRATKNAKKVKDPAAVALGRKGGLKGGPARAKKLTKEQLSDSARNAAQARWGKR
jgi:hypothetical protein